MTERSVPFDLEAEESVLGSCLLSSPNLLDVLAVGITARDFYRPAHAETFAAIVAVHERPAPVDVVSVCARLAQVGKLDDVGGREAVGALIAQASIHATHHARIMLALARCRAAIHFADALTETAYGGDFDQVADMLDRAVALGGPVTAGVDAPIEASQLAEQDAEPDWIVPHLLARLEVVLLVAEPGAGKTTLMRQIAATLASGLHPWTRVPMAPRRVLTFDFQDPPGPAIRATREMLACAGESYRQTWWIELRQQGVDLTSPRDQAWFEAKVAAVSPDVVIAGPLYNMLRGATGRSKQSEETAEIAGRFIMDIMARYGVAFILEAHAPHGDELRVRGSKYWEDFAAFGFGLDQKDTEGGDRRLDVVRFRGDREMGRQWPRQFLQGHGRWPWEAIGIPALPDGAGPDWNTLNLDDFDDEPEF